MSEFPLIELKNLTRYYGQTIAVAGINLIVQEGEVVALLGPNGAGKTTTLRMLVGQLRPTRGNARIGGNDCFSARAAVMRITGYVPDEPIFHDYLSGRELLRFVGGLHGLTGTQITETASYWVERLNLGEAINDYAVNYSRGMKKKLALALALLHKPRLLILDEPANGLDPFATRILLELLTEQAAAGTAILFSTHLLDQAEKISHRAVIIARGQLVAEGTIDDLRSQAASGGNLEQAFFALTTDSQTDTTQPDTTKTTEMATL